MYNPWKVWIWLHTTKQTFSKKIKIITSEKNLLHPKIDTSWTKEIVAALYILLLQYVCNKKNINVRLPFCVEASQKTNFERKFNNWNFEATINISRTEIRSFLQKKCYTSKKEKKCKNCCYLIIKKQNLPMDKNCFSHHKNWVQKIKNQNSSNTPKVNNNQDFLKKKFVSLFLFSLGKK